MEKCFRFRICYYVAKTDDSLPSLPGLILPGAVLSRSPFTKIFDKTGLFDKQAGLQKFGLEDVLEAVARELNAVFTILTSSIYPNPTCVLDSGIQITLLSLSGLTLVLPRDIHTPSHDAKDVVPMDCRVFRHVCFSKGVSLRPKSSMVDLRTLLRGLCISNNSSIRSYATKVSRDW